VRLDNNSDGNALSPQRLVIDDQEIVIAHTLGSPVAPLSPTQAAQKHDLCRVLADDCDPHIFDDPLSYATDPK
jgi:hypothetical protein